MGIRAIMARMSGIPTGLCATCRHQRIVRTTRGSTFSLCERSKVDAAYPKYPRMPVLRCAGWEADQAGTRPAAPPP